MKCSVLDCLNNTKAPRGKSFFRFPKENNRRMEWLEAIRRLDFKPKSSNVVCEDHFLHSQVKTYGRRNILKEDAVPSVGIISALKANTTRLVSPAREEEHTVLSSIKNDVTQNTEEVLNSENYVDLMESCTNVVLDVHNFNETFSSAQNDATGSKSIELSYNVPVDASLNVYLQREEIHNDSISVEHPDVEMSTSDANKTNFNSISYFPSTSVHSRVVQRTVIDNMVKQLTVKKCMESSDEDCIELEPEIMIKKAKLRKLRKCILKKKKTINGLRQKLKRKNKKEMKMDAVLKELRERNLIGEDAETSLTQIVGPCKYLFSRYFSQARGEKKPKIYDERIRSFSLNLNFLSPKAYSYVRKTFSNFLPHSRTIREWYKVVGCSPGFTKEAFIAIKAACDEAGKEGEQLFVNVVFDEMHIRQHIDWDGQNCFGYIDAGDGGKSEIPATQVLVFMAVCINRAWKIPIAFFPIASMNAEQKANIIRLALDELKDTGAKIVGLTFDGAAVNINAVKLLGCDLKNINGKSYLQLENSEEKYLVYPDPCHMVKLCRNLWGDMKTIINSEGGKIEWKYLNNLVELQETQQLHLGNKLRSAHIYFAKKKMNVKLAVQVLSKSVADSIDFCREVLQLPQFSESQHTTEFIRVLNDVFDILNSRKISTFEYKKRALCSNNQVEINEFCKVSITYLSKLKLVTGQLVIDSNRKMGIIGLIACLKNIEVLYKRFILTEQLKFIPLYKLNQDHLELFFSSIRSHLGRNNNPSVKQFIAAYKKLLVRSQIREGGIGNCVPLEHISILNIKPKNIVVTDPAEDINNTIERHHLIDDNDFITDSSVLDQQFFEEHCYAAYPAKLSEFVQHVVSYISGFVVFKINKILKCQECLAALQGTYSPLTLNAYKTRGRLQIPSDSVVEICKKAESVLRSRIHISEGYANILTKDMLLKILIEVQNSFLNKNLFKDQDVHMTSSSHYSSLIKLIADKYLHTRYYFIAKKSSEKISLRQHLTKMVIFKAGKSQMFNYYLKIVPTMYVKGDNLPIHTNQFSVTRYKKDLTGRGERGMPGLFFSYELSPLMVKYTEKERSFGHFATNVCSIVGGVFTVAGIIASFLHNSLEVLQRKLELGKLS